MKVSFLKHNYIDRQGMSKIYLVITHNYQRERLPLDLKISADNWCKKKQRLTSKDENSYKTNLWLESIISKINNIKINYSLLNKNLTIKKLIEEFKDETPSYDFISFMSNVIKNSTVKKSTKIKRMAQVNKLKEYRSIIPFSEIDLRFINDFKSWCKITKNNNSNTIKSTIKIIKQHLRIASKYGVKLNIDLDDIIIGTIKGNRSYFRENEIEALKDLYFSNKLSKRFQLPLGYYLFCCYTGLRISELKTIKRNQFPNTFLDFFSTKENENRTIPLGKTPNRIVENCSDLFAKFISDQKLRDYLNTVFLVHNFKALEFHTSRHTFATNFIRKGGKITDLQVLLGHSKIETTMIYVHLVKAEKISVSILD